MIKMDNTSFTHQAGWALTLASALFSSPSIAQSAIDAGKKIFTQTAVPACAVCHTLKHAESTGEVGPVLDEIKPTADRVEKAVRNGIGQMPSFSSLGMSDEDIKLVAKYVSEVAGK